METLRKRLAEESCGYILFPAGTRSRNGEMNPFRHGVGMLVAGATVPVTPCYLKGTFDALPPGATWPRRRHITLRIGTAQRFDGFSNERRGWRSIAETLERTVRELGRSADASSASS